MDFPLFECMCFMSFVCFTVVIMPFLTVEKRSSSAIVAKYIYHYVNISASTYLAPKISCLKLFYSFFCSTFSTFTTQLANKYWIKFIFFFLQMMVVEFFTYHCNCNKLQDIHIIRKRLRYKFSVYNLDFSYYFFFFCMIMPMTMFNAYQHQIINI